jgi:hypothetical protein
MSGGMYYYEADQSAQVDRTGHNSANIILETRFRNRNDNYGDFFNFLRGYILNTDDVMVVLGFILLDSAIVGAHSMVCVVYDRDHFLNGATLHEPTQLISFGNRALHGNARNAIQTAAAGANGAAFPMTGVGINAQPDHVLTGANANNPAYIIEIDANYLLRQDNVGTVLAAPVPLNGGAPIPF